MQKILKILFLLVSISGFSQSDFYIQLAEASLDRLNYTVTYNPKYYKISYPNGDVPAEMGVCTDVIIRTYRKVGIDLQVLVHNDMKENFKLYPNLWGLKNTDTNIDHRRVPNLMKFFERKGVILPKSDKAADYKPGDIICWNLRGGKTWNGITHIGLVSNKKTAEGKRYLIMHNIGSGDVLEDVMFEYSIIGHYRFKL